MKLPFSLPFGKKEKAQYFLSLLLRDEKANAVIFEEESGKAHVIGEHEEHFNETIETASIEEWLEVLDKAISAAESSLPPHIETQKTIFGVKENWVEDGKIKKDARVRVRRSGEVVGTGKLGQLQSGKQTVNELPEGNEGGLQFDGKLKLEIGDVLEAYKEEEKEKKLVLE